MMFIVIVTYIKNLFEGGALAPQAPPGSAPVCSYRISREIVVIHAFIHVRYGHHSEYAHAHITICKVLHVRKALYSYKLYIVPGLHFTIIDIKQLYILQF